jgi:pimeloyl-ACP methyl ester carboxylesterase
MPRRWQTLFWANPPPTSGNLPASVVREGNGKILSGGLFPSGYEDTIAAYTKGYINGYYFEKSMNSMITQRGMKEAIVVIVNGYNKLEGSFFNNSPVTGNWEDFVVNEAVSYIDSHYRTLPTRDSRAIFGLSMGGYGATLLSMKHPDVFSIGVGECSGLPTRPGL